ncbi:hypothetical protein BDR07DRAFT_1370902 [Suillus spraguei]|nr:hypothetical protein BDR07DRAFT_1370902 [Suillus spraguei]
MYDGPGDKRRDGKLFNQTVIGRWIYGEWDTIGLIKERHLEQPDLIISDITPYFQPFSTLISKLCSLLSEQVNYMKTLDGHGTTLTINSPLTHTQLINTIRLAIDDDDHDKPLSLHTHIRWLIFEGKAPSFITEGDRPYLASKAKRSGAILDNQHSSKHQRTTSGVMRSLNSGTACPIRATRGSGNSTRQSRRHRSGPLWVANHGTAQEEHCKQGEQEQRVGEASQQSISPSPKLVFETLQLQSLKQAISPMTNSPLIQVDTLPNPGDDTGSLQQLPGTKPDEDWDGDDGYDDSLRPDGNNIDREVHDQEYDNEEGQEYDNEEGGWDDGMNGPGDANNSKNADELFGLSGIDVDQFLDLANCHTGPGTLEVDDPHLHNPLIDVQDNKYLTRTNIGHHQVQSLTATLSIDPPIVLILSPMYHPTIVNGTTIMSSPNNSLPTATTIAVLLSLKHNHLVTINVVMSFFGTKKGTGILGEEAEEEQTKKDEDILQFSPPVYRDLLEKAKKRSRLESLNNSFPHHETFLAEDVIEILAELHDQFAAEGCSMEEGYWESYKHNMAIIETCTPSSKAAHPIVQSRYELFRKADEIKDNDDAMEHIHNGIKDLQDEAKFL